MGKYTSEPVILYVQALQHQKSEQFLGDRFSTVCKTVALYAMGMGPSSCLSVTLVHCGETVGWFKMPLVTEVGLGPSDIVLDGDPPLPTERVHHPPNMVWGLWT